MHGVLSIKRTRREPLGADGASSSRECGGPQPGEAASAGSFPAESCGHSGRLGHCCEPSPRGGKGTVHDSGAAIDPLISGGTPASLAAQGPSPLKFLVLAAISFYRACISPAIPSSCRFYPTCSAYAYEAVSKWGVQRGLWIALKRVGRCRPLSGYGYDPVP